MFVMISPLQAHLSETLTSLKFATKASSLYLLTSESHIANVVYFRSTTRILERQENRQRCETLDQDLRYDDIDISSFMALRGWISPSCGVGRAY